MIALDTEDNSEGNVYIINFYDGIRHETFVDKDSEGIRLQAWNWLLQQAPETVWACNMEYDLINLFGAWLGKMCTLQYVRSGLLRASLRDAPIQFFDTLRHWPYSVKKMGAYLGRPKMEANYRDPKYCRQDTEIVWYFVAEMLERYDGLGLKVRATLPSMAMQLWRKSWAGWRHVGELPENVVQYLRGGYYGGRVEVYRFGEIRGTIRHYDINSLFPYVMQRYEYPRLNEWIVTTHPNWQREGMATIKLFLPEAQYQCLPIRTDKGILYPWGYLYGTWPYPEIRQALTDGANILEVEHAVEFSSTCRPFEKYVSLCYGERKRSGSELDNVFWKLMMNSLYGKFGQTDGLEMIYQDRSYTLSTRASHANVIWSAYVTSYARLTLLGWLRRCHEVYYTDTDSLFTPDVLPTDAGLGALKSEGCYTCCEFVGNKIYRTNTFAKAKGIKESAALDFIRTGRAVYTKPARFRESRKSFMKANVWYEIEKVLTSEYEKRRIFHDGRTSAWRLDEFSRVFPDTRVVVPTLRHPQSHGRPSPAQ